MISRGLSIDAHHIEILTNLILKDSWKSRSGAFFSTSFIRQDREELLADAAQMYYEDGLTQTDIFQSIGVTRSAVSRMLSEARKKGVVNIHINRPLRYDEELEIDLAKRFKLQRARVLIWGEQG
jgi:DNA-binding transcriptional regulator LsrR (DeoR family)